MAGAVPGYLPPRPPPVDVIAELNAIEELEPEFPMVAAPTPAPPAPIVTEKLPVSTVVAVSDDPPPPDVSELYEFRYPPAPPPPP